jgi:hypothetical protein
MSRTVADNFKELLKRCANYLFTKGGQDYEENSQKSCSKSRVETVSLHLQPSISQSLTSMDDRSKDSIAPQEKPTPMTTQMSTAAPSGGCLHQSKKAIDVLKANHNESEVTHTMQVSVQPALSTPSLPNSRLGSRSSPEELTKTCKFCLKTLSASQFFASKRTVDGLTKRCRNCASNQANKQSLNRITSTSCNELSEPIYPNLGDTITNCIRTIEKNRTYALKRIEEILKLSPVESRELMNRSYIFKHSSYFIFADLSLDQFEIAGNIFAWRLGADFPKKEIDQINDPNIKKCLLLRAGQKAAYSLMGNLTSTISTPSPEMSWTFKIDYTIQQIELNDIDGGSLEVPNQYQSIEPTAAGPDRIPIGKNCSRRAVSSEDSIRGGKTFGAKNHPKIGEDACAENRPESLKFASQIRERFNLHEYDTSPSSVQQNSNKLKSLTNNNCSQFLIVNDWFISKEIFQNRSGLWLAVKEVIDRELSKYDFVLLTHLTEVLQERNMVLSKRTPWHPLLLAHFIKINESANFSLLGSGRNPSCIAKQNQEFNFEDILYSVLLNENLTGGSQQRFTSLLIEMGVLYKAKPAVVKRVFTEFYQQESFKELTYASLCPWDEEAYYPKVTNAQKTLDAPDQEEDFYIQFL